jgi:GT2 family glycosyltransferase
MKTVFQNPTGWLRAAAVVLILLLPLTALTIHSGDYSWSDLNPNLVYVETGAGSVTFDSGGIHLHTNAAASTSLVTFASLGGPTNASFSFTFQQPVPVGAYLTVGYVSPYNESAIHLEIDGTTGRGLAELVGPSGTIDSTVAAGSVDPSFPFQVLTAFLPPQAVSILLLQGENRTLTQLEYPSLIGTLPTNLVVFLTTMSGPASVTISAAEITLPASGNPQFSASGLALDLQYGAIVLLSFLGFRSEIVRGARRVAGRRIRPKNQPAKFPLIFWWILLVAAVALPLQIWFIAWGSQPYDLFTAELWGYLGTHFNVVSMYSVSPVVPGGKGTFETSFLGSVYPYPPLSAYLYLAAGELAELIPGGSSLPSQSVGYLLKSFSLVFLEVTALVIALELRRAHLRDRWVVAGFAMVAFNPGLLLGSVVWGTFDIVVALMLLLSVSSLRRQAWTWAWFFLFLALFTKQTALLFLPLALPIVFVRAGLWRAIRSGATAFIGVFFTILPLLLLGLSPALVFNSTVGSSVLNVPTTSPTGIAQWQLIVSNGDYGIWPLITALRNGQHGLARLQYPDYLPNQAFGLPYVDVGLVLAAVGILALWLILWRRARSTGFGDEWPLLLVVSFFWCFEVLTRLSPRYLAIAIPLSLVIWLPVNSRRIGVALTTALSAISAISILSVLSLTTAQVPAAGLAPLGTMVSFFVSDNFITALSLAQLLTLVGSFLVLVVLLVTDHFPLAPRKLASPPEPILWRESPPVSVVILNYNGGGLGRSCVDSVLASNYTNVEVIVVDNASRDDSLDRMKDLEVSGRIRVIRNSENEGFSMGNNRGAAAASGTFLLFLNNDTRVDPDAIGRMVEQFRSNPATGACQPVLVSMEDDTKVANAGSQLDTLGFHQVLGEGEPLSTLRVRSPTGFAQGAALMIRASLFREIGGFEPLLRFDHTDSDLSWRTWLAGYQVAVVSDAVVLHAEGRTASATAVAQRLRPLVHGQLVMVTKNYSGFRATRALASLVTIDFAMLGLLLLLGRRAEARAVGYGIGSFLFDLPKVMKARAVVRVFRTITDEEADRRFLRRFNPLDVFASKRLGYGYAAERPLTRF